MMLHRPTRASGTGVLIVPPFGWQEACCHRPLRTWAQALAGAGHAAARLTLPGTGDAAGDAGAPPDMLPQWRAAGGEAAEQLRALTGCRHLVGLGIGLGGTLTLLALQDGVAFDGLILWGTPARGRRALRELVGESRIIAAGYPEDETDEDAGDGSLELTGYRLGAGTAGSVRRLDLTAAPLGATTLHGALLLGRDGLAPDDELLARLRACGIPTDTAPGTEYAAMMAQPQDAIAPGVAITASLRWLAGYADPAGAAEPGGEAAGGGAVVMTGPAAPAPGPTASTGAPPGGVTRSEQALRCSALGVELRERSLWIDTAHGRLFAVHTEPVLAEGATTARRPLCAVLVGAGALHHAGPNRNWVEIARRCAARGIPAIRLDLSGVGEADGSAPGLLEEANLYAEWRDAEVGEVLDALQRAGLGDRFALGGLCAGAYLALHRALADERVIAAWLLNLYAVRWSAGLVAERGSRTAVAAALPDLRRRLRRGGVAGKLAALARPDRLWRVLTRAGERAEQRETIAAFHRLDRRRVDTVVVLSRAEALGNGFARPRVRAARATWARVTTVMLDSRDHMVRARSLQDEISAAIDASVQRIRHDAPGPSSLL